MDEVAKERNLLPVDNLLRYHSVLRSLPNGLTSSWSYLIISCVKETGMIRLRITPYSNDIGQSGGADG